MTTNTIIHTTKNVKDICSVVDKSLMQWVVNLEQLQKHTALFFNCQMILNFDQVGQAISTNPGYLKLRKIRAAQNIARTVRFC